MPDTSDEPIYTLLKQRHAPDYPEQDLRLLTYELKQLQNQAIRAEMLDMLQDETFHRNWTIKRVMEIKNKLRAELRQQVISRYGAEEGDIYE